MKFGGASFRDKESTQAVLEAVKIDDEPKALVLSAIYKMTDTLAQGLHDARKDEARVEQVVQRIRARHEKLAADCISDAKHLDQVMQSIDEKIDELKRLYYGVAYTREISPRTKAKVMSYGERMSVVLFAGVLESNGIPARALESDKIGVITSDDFESAVPKFPQIRENLQADVLPLLDNAVPVITGYFGCNERGETTLLGRNSSDFSAAVVADGLEADKMEVWKDVDGFMSADPRMVENPRLIDTLSYQEAAELSYFGAKILHPRTIGPLARRRIPLYIKNLENPTARGTEIAAKPEVEKNVIKSVTYNRDVSILKIQGGGVGYRPDVIVQIGQKLHESGIEIYGFATSQNCINLLLKTGDVRAGQKAIDSLSEDFIDELDHLDDLAVVGVVGEGLNETPGLAAKVYSAVGTNNINIEMISSGASEVASYFLVKERDLPKTVSAIHENMV